MSGGRLVVCPTPIGNLEDVTLRVLSALRDADVVACEDTRRTRVLLERYGVQASLISYHEHNETSRTPELVRRMRDGAVVALVSDAGMPLVSDPGYVLVQGCVAAGLEVEVLPGPSAALAALVASALPADAWRFAGFLPRKRGELMRVLESPETVVAFESPRRVAASLRALADLDPDRPGGGLPRADQGARGGRTGDGRLARRALRVDAAARRGGVGHRRSTPAIGPRPGGRRRGPPARGRGLPGAGCGGRGRGVDGRLRERPVRGGCRGTNFGWVRRRRVPAARLTLIRDGPPAL